MLQIKYQKIETMFDLGMQQNPISKTEAIEHLKYRSGFPKKTDNQKLCGFDHNCILTNSDSETNSSLINAAMLNHSSSNRALTVDANVPESQLHTSNYSKNCMAFKDNAQCKQWHVTCL